MRVDRGISGHALPPTCGNFMRKFNERIIKKIRPIKRARKCWLCCRIVMNIVDSLFRYLHCMDVTITADVSVVHDDSIFKTDVSPLKMEIAYTSDTLVILLTSKTQEQN
jgi:hypothetical protein